MQLTGVSRHLIEIPMAVIYQHEIHLGLRHVINGVQRDSIVMHYKLAVDENYAVIREYHALGSAG